MVLDRVFKATNGVGNALFGASTTLYSTRIVVPSRRQADAESVISRYQALRAYKSSNRLYDELKLMLAEAHLPDKIIAGFRNPSNSVVEFYCATVFPGANLREALPIHVPINPRNGNSEVEKDRQQRLADAAYQILTWSNWATQKQRYIRDLATTGDGVLKVVTRTDPTGNESRRVFLRMIQPESFTDFDVDERGFVTYVRLDIPRSERQSDGSVRNYIHIEVWDKRLGTYRVWEAPKDKAYEDLEKLGTPRVDREIRDLIDDDFIPFVHTKFIDDGEDRGMAAIEPALDKIDELNAMAARLHRRLFLYATASEQMVSNVLDPDGMPLGSGPLDEIQWTEDGDILRPPPGFRLDARNTNVNFQAMLDAIQSQWDHLRQTDLPELDWGQVGDTTREMSGIALRILLTAALAKAIEVRGNAEAGLIRATQMGLTLAQNGELEQFSESNIGTWDNQDFEFWFDDRTIIGLTEEEEAVVDLRRAEAAEKKAMVGWSNDQIQREFGLSAEEIEQMKNEMPAERAAGALLDAALRRGDTGD